MSSRRIDDLPEHSANCLNCACENRDNRAAQRLKETTSAHTVTGVVAATYLATGDQHTQILWMTRAAINEQRSWCELRGPFRPEFCRIRRNSHEP